MVQYCLQMYFIFVLYLITQVKYVGSQESGITEAEILPHVVLREKCESTFCPCVDFRKMGGIICENGEGNNILGLIFNDFKYLPAKMFLGFHVNDLILDTPDIIVDEKLFEGILALTAFKVRRSKIEIIPDFSIVKDSIKIININSSRLTSLQGKNLQNLTFITYLSFSRNSIKYIEPNVFKGTENVEKLDLSHNLLTSIPQGLLDPMKNLSFISASHNHLQHVDKLFFNTLPKYIFLDFNNITDADFILYLNVEQVEEWAATRSDQNLIEMEVLDLSYNFIKNRIPYRECAWFKLNGKPLFRIQHLNLSGNELLNLETCFQYAQIVKLEVAENYIRHVGSHDLYFAKYTVYLDLQENQIEVIHSLALHSIRKNLRYLNLNGNKLTTIYESLSNLPRLDTLDLSHNLIQTLSEENFERLNKLASLYLDYNQIKDITPLRQLRVLTYLSIRHNNITSIRLNQIPRSLTGISLAGNPIRCDCYIKPFLERLVTPKYPITTDIAVCSRSDLKNGLQQSKDCPNMCSCDCIDNGDVSFMFVDCSSKALFVVPQFWRNNLAEVQVNTRISSNHWNSYIIGRNKYSYMEIEDRILGINLANNYLESLDGAQLPPNVTQLNLSKNKLRRIPGSMFENQFNLKQVSLSGNPWECDCDALEFKKWITFNNHIIGDINNIRCGISAKGERKLNGRIIWKLADLDLCPTANAGLVYYLSFGLLAFVILGLTAKIMYMKYELNIKIFLYYHGFTFVKEDDLDYDKAFDAFISYSHTDDEFVIKDIVSVIEKKDPNIRLCLHYRHFIAGEFIGDNITRAVQSSKRTVVILSRNFLESEWCVLEFRTAHAQVMKDKMHRIVVVKVGDLPKDIDPTIKLYLDSTTYLTWREDNFWNKLLFSLPSQSSIRNPVTRNMQDNEALLNCPFSDL